MPRNAMAHSNKYFTDNFPNFIASSNFLVVLVEKSKTIPHKVHFEFFRVRLVILD